MSAVQLTSAIVIAVGIALMALVVWLVTRRIARRLMGLAVVTRQVALGNTAVEVTGARDGETNNELDIISRGMTDIINYFREMTGVANHLAGGDLTVAVKPRGADDRMGASFAAMLKSLRAAMSQVAENAGQVKQASNQLTDAARQTGDVTGQIAATMQQIAAGTGQQTQSVAVTAQSIDEMARVIGQVNQGTHEQGKAIQQAATITAEITSGIEKVSGNAQTVSRDAAEAARLAREGAGTVKNAITGMEAIRSKVGLSAEKVRQMDEHSRKIGAIIETIQDIAAQTNLLALNAAIEAARAGEDGRGFAVVADEVRKLAEHAEQSTRQVTDLISGITRTVGEAMSAMDEGAREVQAGVQNVNQAGSALENILKAADAALQQAQQAEASA